MPEPSPQKTNPKKATVQTPVSVSLPPSTHNTTTHVWRFFQQEGLGEPTCLGRELSDRQGTNISPEEEVEGLAEPLLSTLSHSSRPGPGEQGLCGMGNSLGLCSLEGLLAEIFCFAGIFRPEPH